MGEAQSEIKPVSVLRIKNGPWRQSVSGRNYEEFGLKNLVAMESFGSHGQSHVRALFRGNKRPIISRPEGSYFSRDIVGFPVVSPDEDGFTAFGLVGACASVCASLSPNEDYFLFERTQHEAGSSSASTRFLLDLSELVYAVSLPSENRYFLFGGARVVTGKTVQGFGDIPLNELLDHNFIPLMSPRGQTLWVNMRRIETIEPASGFRKTTHILNPFNPKRAFAPGLALLSIPSSFGGKKKELLVVNPFTGQTKTAADDVEMFHAYVNKPEGRIVPPSPAL